MVYGYLMKMHFTNKDGYIKVINKHASKELKLSEKTIKAAFNILSGYGLIHKKKIGRCNAYKLMPINSDGYPENIPEYNRPKKSKSKFLEDKQPSTHGVPDHEEDNLAPTGCSIPSTYGVPDNEHLRGAQSQNTPIIEESFKESFKEMLPQGIFLKKYGDKIPNGIIGGFRNEQLEEYYEKYDDEFAEICFAAEKIKCSQRRRYVQGAINKLNNKAQMANEQKAIDEKAQHDIEITMMVNEVSKLANTMFESVR